jgi:hypothetical protein
MSIHILFISKRSAIHQVAPLFFICCDGIKYQFIIVMRITVIVMNFHPIISYT